MPINNGGDIGNHRVVYGFIPDSELVRVASLIRGEEENELYPSMFFTGRRVSSVAKIAREMFFFGADCFLGRNMSRQTRNPDAARISDFGEIKQWLTFLRQLR